MTEKSSIPEHTYSVLVLPFQDLTQIFGRSVSIRSPVSGKVFHAGIVDPGAESILDEKFMALLAQTVPHRLISSGQARGAQSWLLGVEDDQLSERDRALRVGKAVGADIVAVGFIYRFQDRIGTEYSVERPASVAFDVHLIRVDTGQTLWSGSVDETQQVLSDDLFQIGKFIERKGRWVTAEDLAGMAMEKFEIRLP